MSASFPETPTIKLEENTENVTEIQSYLAGFQKEIGADSSIHQATVPENDGEGEEGTYFVDQAGHYYFQAKGDSQPIMTVLPSIENGSAAEDDDFIVNHENEDDPEDSEEPIIQQADNNQILINSGNAYQRVTVVPADASTGELSYVLIVQDPDVKDGEQTDGEQDMAVYDFDEGEEGGIVDSDNEDDKSRVTRILSRKSQVVTQAHMCNYCNYTSPKRYLLSRHMKSHSEERPHKCSVCERGFKTMASLQNHVNTHTGTKPHACKFCDAAFTTSGELVRHVRYRHTHEKPHKCTECDYASVELSKLKRHIRCHTGERPYQCPHCTYASPDTFKLKRHLRIHTGEKPYQCDVCQARFTQSNSLKAHKLTHNNYKNVFKQLETVRIKEEVLEPEEKIDQVHYMPHQAVFKQSSATTKIQPDFDALATDENVGDKPVFQCDLCPTTCGRKTDLRIHVLKLHTSDKPLKCKRCGKSFPDRYSYKLHNKSHEGEKCYKCDLCPYASISARHLESHILIHTDQKPYQCDQCDQSFRQKQLLKRHQNLYHNPDYIPPPPREKTHECPECTRTFRHKGNLIRHMAAHDPDPTIQRKQLELKLGRQKKIQMIDGQPVEVMPGIGSEEEEEIDMMAVEGSDGQQYVVLEVIQLADGEEQTMVVSEGASELLAESILPDNELNDEEVIKALQNARRITKQEIEDEEENEDLDEKKVITSDMQNCFGFDDEEDDDDDVRSGKETITLLGGID